MKKLIAAITLIAATAGIASGQLIVQTFDTDPALADTQAPDTWYKDRKNPAGFESTAFDGDNRLQITVSAEDENVVDGFYLYQGRKYDTPGATRVFGDIYAGADLEADGQSWSSGIWGTAIDSDGVISYYPILAMVGAGDGSLTIKGFNSFVGWDYEMDASNLAGTWVNFDMRLSGSNWIYSVNGTDVYTTDSNLSASFSNIILNTYNYQDDLGYSVYWDNVGFELAPVPEPSTIAGLSILGLGMILGIRRRFIRRRK